MIDSDSQKNGVATSPRDFRFQPSLVGTETFHSGKCELSAVTDKREFLEVPRYLSPSIFRLLVCERRKLFGRLMVTLETELERLVGEGAAIKMSARLPEGKLLRRKLRERGRMPREVIEVAG